MHAESLTCDRTNARVLLIRGAPGLGKSTLAEMLRPAMHAGAVVDVDDIRRMICGERFVYKENGHYLKAVRVAADLARALSKLGCKPVTVVDVFAVEAFHVFMQAMHGADIFSISLYTDDDVLSDRMRARHGGYVNVDVARSVNQHIYDTRELCNTWLNIGTLSASETRDRLLEFMAHNGWIA